MNAIDEIAGALGYLGHAVTCASVMLGEECDCGNGRAVAALENLKMEHQEVGNIVTFISSRLEPLYQAFRRVEEGAHVGS